MKSHSLDNINWLQRGKLLAQLGQLEVALDCFDRAILLEENSAQAQREKELVSQEIKKNNSITFA